MSALQVKKRPRPKIQGSFEVVERRADPHVMNWAVNRYCEWLIRQHLKRDSQPAEKNGRL